MDFVAGWFGGAAGLLVGHPFDTIKVRLQTDFANKFKGGLHCLSHTVKQEGARALYKGMASPMFGMAFINAIIFGVHGTMMKFLQPQSELPKLTNSFLAGATAGGIQSMICCPMELVKSRMQVQDNATKFIGATQVMSSKAKGAYSSPLDVVLKIYRKEGLMGLNRGMVATLCREIPAFGFYFSSYDLICQLMIGKDGRMADITPFQLCIAGGISGTTSWVVTYPIDVVKSRIQVDVHGRYRGMMDCFRATYHKSGVVEGFYKGITTTVSRAFPVNAVTFTVVALIHRYS